MNCKQAMEELTQWCAFRFGTLMFTVPAHGEQPFHDRKAYMQLSACKQGSGDFPNLAACFR